MVKFPLDQETENQADLLIEKLRLNKGVYAKLGAALSAPQIGILKRIFVIGNVDNPKFLHRKIEVIINPEILDHSVEINEDEEGCISIPKLVCIVKRFNFITCSYYNLRGDRKLLKIGGLKSRVFQHEIDHLNGIHMLKSSLSTSPNPLYEEFIKKQISKGYAKSVDDEILE